MVIRRGFLLALLAVAALLLALRALVGRDPAVRNWEIFTEMAYSVAGESFAAAPALPGGTVQQPLPAAVLVRGAEPFFFGEGDEEAARAGEVLVNPFSREDEAAVEAGRRIYQIHCVHCHGADGGGQGPAVLRGMIPAASFHAASAMQAKDGQLFHVLTRGKGNMVPVTDRLTPEERWQVILWIRRLQEQQP